MEHIIKYYPVGNADCTLIKLDNGMTILVDCQILSDLTDGNGKQVMFDVKADVLKELKKTGWDVLMWISLSVHILTMTIAKDLLETFIVGMCLTTIKIKTRMR